MPAEPSAQDLEDEWAYALEGTGTGEWERAWVEALLATDRQDEAQQFRWARFEARLDAADEVVGPDVRYGYRRITALLRDAGWVVSVKRVERIWAPCPA